jgi:hypothetical protein
MRTVLDLVFHPLAFLLLAIVATIVFGALAAQYHPNSTVGHDGTNAGMGVITGCLWLAAAILAARRD